MRFALEALADGLDDHIDEIEKQVEVSSLGLKLIPAQKQIRELRVLI